MLLCPLCFHQLRPMGAERLETLSDHVDSPNEAPPYRTAYGCPVSLCSCYLAGTRWTAEGEGPFREPWDFNKVPWYVLGHGEAIFGWHWRYSIRRYWERKLTFRIPVKGYEYEFALFDRVSAIRKYRRDGDMLMFEKVFFLRAKYRKERFTVR